MAEETENIPLEQFIEEQAAILQSENTTAEQINIAFYRMRQYRPLRDLLDQQKDIVAASLGNPEEAKKVFLSILEKERSLAGKEPEALDNPRPPAEIAARAAAFREAQVRTNDAIKNKLPNLKTDSEPFGRIAARAYNNELVRRQIYGVPLETIEEKFIKATEEIPSAASSEETRKAFTSTFAATIENDTPHQDALIEAMKTIELPQALVQAAQIKQQTNRIILENPDITRPDLLVAFIAQEVNISEAVRFTNAVGALSADINPASDITRPSGLFQAVATTPFQKIIAPAADAFLTVLPQGTREQIIESVLTDSWKRVTDKLGEAIVSSPAYRDAIIQGNRAFSKPTAPGGAAAGATKVVSDFLGTLFGTGLDPEMQNKIVEAQRRGDFSTGRIAEFIPLTGQHLVSVDHVTATHYYAAIIMSEDPRRMSMTYKGGRWILGLAGQKLMGIAAKAAATKITGAVIGGTLGSVIPVVGNLVGAAIGWIGGKVLSGFKSLVGGLLGLRGGEEGPWWQNILIMGPLLIIGTIVLLFVQNIFPVNAQQIGVASQESALADMQKGIGVGGPAIDCAKTPDIPECKLSQCKGDCKWPLDTSTGACIIEGPYVGTHGANHLSAVDFVSPGNQGDLFGSPVYTQYSGMVSSSTFGYADGCTTFNGCITDGNTYGNNVVIQTDKGASLLFAHLRNIRVVSRGDHVSAGTVIGYVDHTGYSEGVHLHFEARGGDVNDYLPYPVPPCDSYQDCSAKIQATGHSACI